MCFFPPVTSFVLLLTILGKAAVTETEKVPMTLFEEVQAAIVQEYSLVITKLRKKLYALANSNKRYFLDLAMSKGSLQFCKAIKVENIIAKKDK